MALWVTEKKGICRTGRVHHEQEDRLLVQFGPDGPFSWRPKHLLRGATQEEIADKEGVRPTHHNCAAQAAISEAFFTVSLETRAALLRQYGPRESI